MQKVLAAHNHDCRIAEHTAALVRALGEGAAVAVVAAEALGDGDALQLKAWLGRQDVWSDFPFVVLVPQRTGTVNSEVSGRLQTLGNIVLLERPVSRATLVSAVDSAFRGRMRQYEARAIMADKIDVANRLLQSKAELHDLNANLEHRIRERTLALAQANDRLMAEGRERERMQQALIQLQKMEAIGQLTGGIAHDFNNLLNVIQGNLDLIALLSKDDAVRARADIARRTCLRGAKLTSQLLAFSRNQRLTLASIDLIAMFGQMQELLRTSLGSAIRISIEIDPACQYVMSDANQLEMAVLNLAINARDAMPGGGVLRFTTRTEIAPPGVLAPGSYGVVAVSDTGGGIPSSILQKVFDPFFTTKEIGKGTGLGLSQVYGIAQQSGGTAQIHSSSEGTTVEIWLPLAEAVAVASNDFRAGELPRGDAKILIVEDDPSVREAMVEMLAILGYVVHQAANGTEGLDMIKAAQFDLLITDFLMPGMTGAELIEKAKILQPSLPVIIVTGFADMAAVDAVVSEQCLLRKPFQLDVLANKVSTVLRTASHC